MNFLVVLVLFESGLFAELNNLLFEGVQLAHLFADISLQSADLGGQRALVASPSGLEYFDLFGNVVQLIGEKIDLLQLGLNLVHDDFWQLACHLTLSVEL